MSEKTPTNADKGTEKATQEGDGSSTENTDQTDTSQSTERNSNLEEDRQNDQQLARDNGDLEQKLNFKEPPKETKEAGPPQGPEEPQQDHKIGSSPNHEPESKETRNPSPPPAFESGEPPSGNQEPGSPGTQQPSPSQTQSPADKTPIKQNTGQEPTEQKILQETQNPADASLEQNSGSQPPQEESPHEKHESDQQPTEPGLNNLPHSEKTDSKENIEMKKNDHTDSTPPTKLETAKVEASTTESEGKIPPDDTDHTDTKIQFQGSEDEAKATSNQQAELTITDETPMEQNVIYQRGETKESEMDLEPQNEERDESRGEKNDKPADPSVSTEMTGQEGEDQTLQTEPNQEQGEVDEHEVFQEQVEPDINVVFIETSDEPAIEDLLKNCQKYEDELRMGEILKGAVEEYKTLLKKAKETGCQKQKSTPPPSELNSVNAKERKQAPLLYTVIAFVSEKVPNYKRWREAVSEFIILTTLSQSEPPSSQKKRSNSQSGYQNKSKPSAKSYNNNIEKLLDQDWGPNRAPGPSVYNDYRHLFTCESVLRSTFPEADVFSLVDSKIRGPEDVPPELQHKALFNFLLSFNRKKYGVEPSDAWRDFGRLVLAEKQLDLARKAQGPDLHQNVIVKRLDFYKMQNELKEKTEEVEELSTRLSKFASQQLTEGNPNIADLSDTHRPTRLGEMYSQLFDDEWSEAFEAFKPKTEDEDDDIFPDTLYILQDLLTNIFDFCKDQSKSQKIFLEDSFALAIGLTEPQKGDAATKTDNTLDGKDAPKLDEKEQTGSVGDKGSSPGKSTEEEQVKEQDRETGGEGESSEQLSTPPVKEDEDVGKETSNKLETDKSEEVNKDSNSKNMQETPSHATQTDIERESSKTLETDEGNTTSPTDKTENGTDEHVEGERQDKNPEGCPKADEGNDVNKIDESAKLDENKGEQSTGDNGDSNGDQEIKNSGQGDPNQQTDKDTVGEEPSNETPIEKNQEVSEEGKTDTDKSDSSQKDPAQGPEKENKPPESKDYRKSAIYPTIDRHARDFRKAAASTSAKTKSKLFIATELPDLIADETVRADVRVLTYVRKCVELCWYMCMQDPPMVIISPQKGQLVDKALFSFHGRRGKIVEVCVWPALLLHDNGPLVCKGYVLPEERNRNR
uniref:Mitochondria-eating protein C-terminal domain-containing protein n=2 Tax=Magallana gigas TaxID=29159 RepID=A0A8W8KIX6_MAGGI|nr:uncharacterized protein LOC105333281 isoform X1 [Crassostrea gigas]